LVEKFGIARETVVAFFDKARSMSHYDDQSLTARDLFNEFFPNRQDIVRLLMEPITYANGSTLDDPALTYGIVFSNFMSKGVYTFQGGTDLFIDLMTKELLKNGVDILKSSPVRKILVESGKINGVEIHKKNGEKLQIRAKAVLSNANLKGTIFNMVGQELFSKSFIEQANAVRLNNSSTQVYIAMKRGFMIDENSCGDLLFTSTAPVFDSAKLLDRNITSRTFSFYYPKTRPNTDLCYVVSSTNAHFADWDNLTDTEYQNRKQELIAQTKKHLAKYIPDLEQNIDWLEAATPKTFERYTEHWSGASFGTKYEGLAVSRNLNNEINGLFHSGSVGIIMSGWLGAVNYGVIVANDIAAFLMK
jgi:phytoene dehydrogenase-like protein